MRKQREITHEIFTHEEALVQVADEEELQESMRTIIANRSSQECQLAVSMVYITSEV